MSVAIITTPFSSAHSTGSVIASLWRSADRRSQASEIAAVMLPPLTKSKPDIGSKDFDTFTSKGCGEASRTPRAEQSSHVECTFEWDVARALLNKLGKNL